MIVNKTMILMKGEDMNINKTNTNKFYELDAWQQHWIINLGMRMSDIVSKYAISDDEIVSISNDVAEYVTHTRNADLRSLLFDENNNPRLIIKR